MHIAHDARDLLHTCTSVTTVDYAALTSHENVQQVTSLALKDDVGANRSVMKRHRRPVVVVHGELGVRLITLHHVTHH